MAVLCDSPAYALTPRHDRFPVDSMAVHEAGLIVGRRDRGEADRSIGDVLGESHARLPWGPLA
jgi:hypothetical protein